MGEVLHPRGARDRRRWPAAPPAPWSRSGSATPKGLYDHPRQSGRERRDAAFQGYGRMMADAQGLYRFRTLKPVAYPGRTPHIHLKAATGDGRLLTSQFYIAGDPRTSATAYPRRSEPGQRSE